MGRARPSIRDVAERAGVSIATVSNALNHPEQVALATRARVEQAVAELDFVMNASARQLRVGHSRTVGVIVLDLGNPFYTELARGIEDRLAQDDCTMMMCSSDDDPERESRFMRLFAEQGVRGILITPSGNESAQQAYLERLGVAAVWLDSTSAVGSSVSVDHVDGGRQAVAHLLARGHRRIGLLNGPQELKQCLDRADGARLAVAQAGLDPAQLLEPIELSTMTAAAGQTGLAHLLDATDGVSAVFCINDTVAMGAMRECRLRRLRIPQDIAIVGYDDVAFGAELFTPLSSVRQPMHRLGWTAVELLLADNLEPRHVSFEPELVVRASSDYDHQATEV